MIPVLFYVGSYSLWPRERSPERNGKISIWPLMVINQIIKRYISLSANNRMFYEDSQTLLSMASCHLHFVFNPAVIAE
jgi:hypothetical protein